MKKMLVYFLLFLFSCGSKNIYETKKEEIVDYNQTYEYYNRSLRFDEYEQKTKEQTLFLINKKEVSFEKFKKSLDLNKINNIQIVEDSVRIRKLNYSFDNVKKIIIATKR